MNLTPATFTVLYDSVNITKDISDHLLSLTYTDKVQGESDEIELSLEDSELLWQNSWYPKKGATLQVTILQDGLQLNCGTFTIDEIEMSSSRGSGDTINIRGLAAGITKKLRSKRSTAHENKTLREIANTIAAANGLTVVGSIADITFNRVTQYNKTDLSFLKELAADYGYIFSIRDKNITFTNIYELEARTHVLTLDKTDLLSWSLKDKTAEVYKAATVTRHNPNTNTTIAATQDNSDTENITEDTLKVPGKAENKQQAEAKAKAALHKNNSQESDGNVSMAGNTLIIAGNNFELTGMGMLSGINHIISSTHTIDRGSGYVVAAEIKRVKKIAAGKHKPKTTKPAGRNTATLKPVTASATDFSFQNATNNFIAGGAVNTFGN